MPERDTHAGLEDLQEGPANRNIEVRVVGRDLINALDELSHSMIGVDSREGVVRRAISLLYQARGRTVLLVDEAGNESQLQRLWR